MITKNEINSVKSLHKKKDRNNSELFIAEGSKLVIDLINSGGKIKQIFAIKEWIDENNDFLKLDANLITQISHSEMERITGLAAASPVLCVFYQQKNSDLSILLTENIPILVLEDIRDPGNMGTIIRTADWFGVKNIVCSINTVDCYNSKVIQSTMGSINRVSIYYTNIVEFLKLLPENRTKVGTFLEGKLLSETKMPLNSVIIIGNEAHGISQEVENMLNIKTLIPGIKAYKKVEGAESLNASIATSIVLYEYFMQQR